MVTCNIGYNKLRGYLFTRDKSVIFVFITLTARADCCSFPFLSELDLSGNELIGPIPPTLGQLTQLRLLLLENNQLSSEVMSNIYVSIVLCLLMYVT
jgi:hypothetical protein